MNRRWLNEKGTQLVQLALVLPVMLLVLYGSFEVWRVLQARDALQEGVFQAVIYFSTFGYEESSQSLRDDAWEIARDIVSENLRGTGIVDEEDLDLLQVFVTYDPGQLECDDPFTVEATLPFQLHFAPLARTMTLTEKRVGRYQCLPPEYSIEIQWPVNGQVECLSQVRFIAHCYTSPIYVQVRVKSGGILHYESNWFPASCGQLEVHTFPQVPSGGWEIQLCARGGRSELEVCAESVRGSCP